MAVNHGKREERERERERERFKMSMSGRRGGERCGERGVGVERYEGCRS